MALEDDFGYEVDKTTKKIEGKVSKPLKVKLMVKSSPTVSVKPKKKKSQLSELKRRDAGGDSTPIGENDSPL
tara:strand:- start:8231 stop:8446 length:216 start_codon:yes stop_codon:yes gene_type:complete